MFQEIVSKCPVCAAPIYGAKVLEPNTFAAPAALFTCDCRFTLLEKIRNEVQEKKCSCDSSNALGAV